MEATILRVELTPEEAETLRDVLWDYLGELRAEIAGTESLDFRAGLKKREAFTQQLLQRLGDDDAG